MLFTLSKTRRFSALLFLCYLKLNDRQISLPSTLANIRFPLFPLQMKVSPDDVPKKASKGIPALLMTSIVVICICLCKVKFSVSESLDGG